MEQVSRGVILDIILALPIALLWAFFPDMLAAIFQIMGQSIINIFHNLPYSRALESEADDVGLILAAKVSILFKSYCTFEKYNKYRKRKKKICSLRSHILVARFARSRLRSKE